MGSSNRKLKLALVGGVVLLVVAGVAVLKNTEDAQINTTLERAQALAKMENANTPLSQLPHESAVKTPLGWDIESDEPVDDEVPEAISEQLMGDLEQDSLAEDDDIDSPMQVEEDANGQEFVAELDPAVIVDDKTSAKDVVEDGQGYNTKKCFKNLKTCGAKKSCTRKCKKKCKPYAIRKCAPKKFCRCFCKYYGKLKTAKRCVVYQTLMCKYWRLFRCQRNCKKFCKRVPHCYCCPKTHIRRKCRQLCKRTMYRSKCARCRCAKLKCYKTCRFVCVKKYKK